jgi:predicted nucleotidyltransferase
LSLLLRRGHSDPLEENALKLIQNISTVSGISSGFFGVHGSISIGMHHEGSDLDIAVYGRTHFQRMRQALLELESQGIIILKRGTRFERRQLNRGFFNNLDFVVNATRRFSEITGKVQNCKSVGEVEVRCRCKSAGEAMFRPAIYQVEECQSIRGLDLNVELVSEVVSMIGLYRNFIEAGDVIEARGMLEEVVESKERRYFRIVVGSGLKGEYIDCVGL